MLRMLSLAVACLGLAGVTLAAAPTDEAVQGLYEGTCKSAAGEQKESSLRHGHTTPRGGSDRVPVPSAGETLTP